MREKVSDLVSVRRNKVFTGLQNIKSSAPVEVRGQLTPLCGGHTEGLFRSKKSIAIAFTCPFLMRACTE